MMIVYKLLLVFFIAVLLKIAWRDAKKWDWVTVGMILVPMILRLFGIK